MKNNIVIALVFLALIAVFANNFENFTGYAVNIKIPGMNVNPKIVQAGENINFRVKINQYCVRPEYEILTETGLYKDKEIYLPTKDDCQGQNVRTCKGSKYCQGDLINDVMDINYRTKSDLNGRYKIRVKYIEKPGQDEYDLNFIEQEFDVV